MLMKGRVLSAILILISLTFATCRSPQPGKATMVTKDQALDLARQELTKQGYIATDYDISVDIENSDQEHWMIWCEEKGPFPVPGGRHGVRVNKLTGQSQFLVGE